MQKKICGTSCKAQTELCACSSSFMCYLRVLALEVNAPTHNNRIGGGSAGVDTFFFLRFFFPALFGALSAITGKLELVFLLSTSRGYGCACLSSIICMLDCIRDGLVPLTVAIPKSIFWLICLGGSTFVFPASWLLCRR